MMNESIPPEPVLRSATAADDPVVGRLIHSDPSPETIGIAGDPVRAAALPLALFYLGAGRAPQDEVVLATLDGVAQGVLVMREAGANYPVSLGMVPKILRAVFGLYHWWEVPGLLRRVQLRRRLEFPIPDGSLHLIEMHVDPKLRGRGIGGALLHYAERRARELGCTRTNLTTALSNPARRLYERMGYEMRGEKTVPGYEEVTGTPGRAFYEKVLT